MSYWRGKIALVTGGSGGFGLALTRTLAAAGAKLAVVDRDAECLDEVTRQLQSAGHDATGFLADVTRTDQVESVVADAVRTYGGLDLLANVVGRSTRGNILDTTPETFRELIELNFLSMVRGTRAAAPHLIRSGGHVVNMGSLAAKTAARFLGAYPVSKFAVAAYSQQLRYELAPLGVHVLLVCPGPMKRSDAGRRYDNQIAGLPDAARQPGGGVRLKGIDPQRLARRILCCCERRVPELVMPAKARWLFAISQIWPSLGDRLLLKMTRG